MKKIKLEEQKETYSYKGWANSDDFFKRSIGIWGYCLMGQLLFWVGVMVVWAAIAMIAFLLTGTVL